MVGLPSCVGGPLVVGMQCADRRMVVTYAANTGRSNRMNMLLMLMFRLPERKPNFDALSLEYSVRIEQNYHVYGDIQ